MKNKIDLNYLKNIFIKYVKVDTQANEESKKTPSSDGQLELGKIIVEDLKTLGIVDSKQDKNGYVVGRVKGNTKAPTICFIAHLDTVQGISGKGVQPIVHENYDGKDIVLPKDGTVISPKEFSELMAQKGKTIITTSGDTLLGGDDKAGIAICMETAKFLMENKDFPHGDVCFVFTPDEEIGHGAELLDLQELNAVCGYTLDSDGVGTITNETFCADYMTITIKGRNIHPGLAKGKMINALRVATRFLEKLPMDSTPETTEGYEGFLHPLKMKCEEISDAKIEMLVRDFKVDGLTRLEDIAKKAAKETEKDFPGSEIHIEIREQYRNMVYQLEKDPRVVGYAQEAMKQCGMEPKFLPARGGTDGSRLSYRGLLTPDFPVGTQAVHSKQEWVCLEEMETTADIIKQLIKIWAIPQK